MKDYQSVRRDLLGMLEDLDDRLEHIADDKPSDDSKPAVANTTAETDLSEVAQAEVEKIKQTIARIQSGRAGICLLCGEPIAKQRLARMPYAHYCAQCASSSD